MCLDKNNQREMYYMLGKVYVKHKGTVIFGTNDRYSVYHQIRLDCKRLKAIKNICLYPVLQTMGKVEFLKAYEWEDFI